VAVEKVGFPEKVENRVMENVHQTGENRLQSFLPRSSFCEIEVSEFFNSHRVYHHQSQNATAASRCGEIPFFAGSLSV
jgi:hypothetical protein